ALVLGAVLELRQVLGDRHQDPEDPRHEGQHAEPEDDEREAELPQPTPAARAARLPRRWPSRRIALWLLRDVAGALGKGQARVARAGASAPEGLVVRGAPAIAFDAERHLVSLWERSRRRRAAGPGAVREAPAAVSITQEGKRAGGPCTA